MSNLTNFALASTLVKYKTYVRKADRSGFILQEFF